MLHSSFRAADGRPARQKLANTRLFKFVESIEHFLPHFLPLRSRPLVRRMPFVRNELEWQHMKSVSQRRVKKQQTHRRKERCCVRGHTLHPTLLHDKPKKSYHFRNTETPADTAEGLHTSVRTNGYKCGQFTLHAVRLTSAQPQNIRFESPLVLNFVWLSGGVPVFQIRCPMGERIRDLELLA